MPSFKSFKPNDLQRALFVEVMNSTMSRSGDDLVDHGDVVYTWLLHIRPILSALAGIGRAAVRSGRSDRDTMMLDCVRAMMPLPDETLWWLGQWNCLSCLIHPDVLRDLDDSACRAQFQTLATLDEGL